MTKQEDHVRKQVLDTLESYEQLTKEEHLDGEAAFERVKELFGNEVAGREELIEYTLAALEHAFEFHGSCIWGQSGDGFFCYRT